MSLNIRSKITSTLLTAAFTWAVTWVLISLLAIPAAAESPAELLEKGIYTEQTVGDLAQAIEIYSSIVDNDQANRRHAAQAQFRLGMCHLKGGDEAQARQAFEQLIERFPEQEQLVSQAQKELVAAQPSLPLSPEVPWVDGEALTYKMSLPTGKEFGALYLRAESTEVEGREAWRLEMRRFAANQSDNYGVSWSFVDAETHRPIRSAIRHGVLGNAIATFEPEGVTVQTQADESQFLESHQAVFDNDQTMHLMRLLPLEVGYGVKLNLLPIWTATIIELGLEVKAKKTCRVPAGEFECFKVAIDNGETYWISTGPERYPLKIKGGGVVVELAEIGRVERAAEVDFALDDFGFAGKLPNGWIPYIYRVPGRKGKAMVRLLDPDAAAISSIELDRCPPGRCPTLKETAERELAGAKKRFEGFELRQDSWTESTLDGRPAISFVGDFERNGQAWVQHRVYTLSDSLRVELIFRVPAELYEALRPRIDTVIENVDAE